MVNRAEDGEDLLASIDYTLLNLNQADGPYAGHFKAFLVDVNLDVTLKNQSITDIVTTKHVNGKGQPAEAITQSIINSQSLMVDDIAGATMSSQVIKAAVQDALLKKGQ